MVLKCKCCGKEFGPTDTPYKPDLNRSYAYCNEKEYRQHVDKLDKSALNVKGKISDNKEIIKKMLAEILGTELMSNKLFEDALTEWQRIGNIEYIIKYLEANSTYIKYVIEPIKQNNTPYRVFIYASKVISNGLTVYMNELAIISENEEIARKNDGKILEDFEFPTRSAPRPPRKKGFKNMTWAEYGIVVDETRGEKEY